MTMSASDIRTRGIAARETVRAVWPDATSTYTETGAEVYDPETHQVLGTATACENPVEVAWIDAARAISGEQEDKQ